MLQAQQQQIMAQHQQYAQAGLLPSQSMVAPQPPPQNAAGLMPPPPPPPPSNYMTPNGPFGQFTANTSNTTSYQQQHQQQQQQQSHRGGHRRAQSSIPTSGGGGGSFGHGRRHSLALNEAKKAAALAQAKRNPNPDSPPNSSPDNASSSNDNSNNAGGNPMPSFKFPADRPDTSASSSASASSSGGGFRGHGRSQSMQQPSGRYNNRSSSPNRSFQFPASSSPNMNNEGGGHHRSNSRNFDSNWRQPPQDNNNLLSVPNNNNNSNNSGGFVPGHRSRGSFNSSFSSMSGFYPQMQGGNNNSNTQGRKSLFAPYLPQASLPGLLDEGRLVAGTLRVNKKNRSDAYVSTNGLLDADIFICGSKDRNRALEGDLVAVELLEVDEVWGSKREKEEKKKRKDNDDGTKSNSDATTVDSDATTTTTNLKQGASLTPSNSTGSSTGGELRRKGSLKQRPTQKKNDDVEVEGQSLLLVEEEELSDQAKPLYAGHVVAVIERIPGQMFSGTLGLLRPSSQATKDKQDAEKREKGERIESEKPVERPKIVWFKPSDKRVPLIAIPTEQAPKDFVENNEKYADEIFIASIKRWPITSLHPFGTLVEELGPADDPELEVEAVLRDNNFTADQFPDSVQKSLSSIPFELSEEEKNNRVDYTSNYTVSFSPNGKLLDQAVHLHHLADGNIEFGVHITDISYFVRPNSPLDREAKKRGSSVFLKQRDHHLFPKEFINTAGLEVGKTTPTISVVFELDSGNYSITDFKIELGYIKPQSKLDFDTVNKVLNNDDIKQVSETDYTMVQMLQKLSIQFRKERFNAESGNMPILGLLDQIDDENVQVTSNIYDTSLAKQMLGEINIQTNRVVAQKLQAELKGKAFLRRHSEPILQRLESFSDTVRSLNLGIDTSSSAELQKSLLNIKSDEVRKSLETLLWKSMSRAKYFVAGKEDPENFGHYYFNVPLYTHFTAPLRRYADVIVHQQIKAVLTKTAYEEDIETLSNTVDYCNFKKDAAKGAQEQSIHLHLCQVINEASASTEQLIRDAIVVQVYESAFDVFLPDLGIEKRVHGDQLPLVKAEFHKSTKLLELYWEKSVDTATFIPDDEKSRLSHSPSEAKQKYKATSAESAAAQNESERILSEKISGLSLEGNKNNGSKSLDRYLEGLTTRIENDNYVQEIRILQHVPVLLRSEVRKGTPCLTVRTLNPFTK